MSFTFDGALSNVLPTSAESKRALTPSKLFTRPVTPQRSNSAPRSNSNNRETRPTDIALASHVDRRSRSGAISTRKLRRWENKNLFGVETFSKSKEDRIVDSLNNQDLSSENAPFEITWKSTLSKLLRPENQEVLHDFLTCRDVFTTGKNKTQLPRKGRPAHRSDWSDAEDAWMKVEKRIRAAISRSFATSEVIEEFLEQLERVILHFVHTKQALGMDRLSDELKKELAQPISVDRAGNLVIPLHESAFRRLLVHGVAQFYGLQSNSVKGKNDQHKSCLIKLPKVVVPATKPVDCVPSAPVASPSTTTTTTTTTITSHHLPAAAPLPPTATRCLSLVRYLTLVVEQQQAHALHAGAEEAVMPGFPETDRPSTTSAMSAPAFASSASASASASVTAQGQEVVVPGAGKGTSSSGSGGRAPASASASASASGLHVMSAIERRLASLTVRDAPALVTSTATTTVNSDPSVTVEKLLAAVTGAGSAGTGEHNTSASRESDEESDGDGRVDNGGNSPPIQDLLASDSLDPFGYHTVPSTSAPAETLREHVLVTPGDTPRTPVSDEYVVV